MLELDCATNQVVPGTSEPLQVLTNPNIIELDDFDPQPRDRCNTWPLQKPTGDLSHHTSPLIHEEIPEEGSIPGSRESLTHSLGYNSSVPTPQTLLSDSPIPGVGTPPPDSMGQGDDSSGAGSGVKKNSARRNAWGNMSYADLITQAILSSPEQRLTLSQVYDWMVQNVPYFRDKGDSNSSAGWKNSIRHNLSLHSRFMRIQNEGAGKSSWWVINPDAKPGKASRRRAATLETKTMEKKRGRVKKKVEALRQAALSQGVEGVQVLSPAISDNSEPFYDGSLPFNPGEFRDRSGSNLSNYSLGGSSNCINRLSPSFEELMDNPATWNQPHTDYNDILDMANIRLGDPTTSQTHFISQNSTVTISDQKPPPPPYQQVMANRFTPQSNGHVISHPVPVKLEPGFMATSCSQQHHQTFGITAPGSSGSSLQQMGGMFRSPVKQEFQPSNNGTCYQELNPTSVTEIQNNPMLRDALVKVQHPHQFQGIPMDPHNGPMTNGTPLHHFPGPGINGQLPSDVSDIHFDPYSSGELQCDIDAVLRHELNVAGKLDFNMDTYGGM